MGTGLGDKRPAPGKNDAGRHGDAFNPLITSAEVNAMGSTMGEPETPGRNTLWTMNGWDRWMG